MRIESNLFDECFEITDEIVRICLKGNGNIPKELIDYGKEKDKDNFGVSCFSIDIILENENAVCGVINYMGEHEMFSEIPCDNYIEAYEYYKTKMED